MLKIDVFILKDSSYDRTAFQRKKKEILEEEWETSQFYFASPEDIILNKLEWYKMGGNVSERQWCDVLGVIKVQREVLDIDYLRYWGKKIGVVNLLEKALSGFGT